MIPTVFVFPSQERAPAASKPRAPHQSAAPAELKCRFPTRAAAHQYLSSRGFLYLPSGWANGWWRASVEVERDEYVVVIRLHHMTAA